MIRRGLILAGYQTVKDVVTQGPAKNQDFVDRPGISLIRDRPSAPFQALILRLVLQADVDQGQPSCKIRTVYNINEKTRCPCSFAG